MCFVHVSRNPQRLMRRAETKVRFRPSALGELAAAGRGDLSFRQKRAPQKV
jgi:hypothetical protein